MPQYNGSGSGSMTSNSVLPAAMWPGDQVYVFGVATPTPGQIPVPNDANVQFEAVVVGERSIAVTLASRPGGGSPPGIAVLVTANGNPGAAEIDVQNSPLDADGAYQTPSNAAYKLTVWNASGVGQYSAFAELQPEGDNFVTLKVIANPNGVKFAAKIVYI